MTREFFQDLLREHRDRIYSHALYSLRDRDDAEDVTQEAFLRLWRTDPDVPPERLGAWLTRVAHNLCIDHVRRRKTVRVYFGRPDPDALDSLAAAAAVESPPEALGQELLDAMESLSAETRSVMLMHYQQGLKLREIADLLDQNVNSLKVRIHRARKTLREVLERPGQPPLAARGKGH
ncbi:MAG: RNA polymerase sigma factor [Candidatus Krumholzibacteriia bacterium]